jgi:hypothetical protein
LKQIFKVLVDENLIRNTISYYWKSLLYIYVTEGSPLLDEINFETKILNWEDIISHTINQDEVHKIKYIQISYDRFLEKGDENNYLISSCEKILNIKDWKY